jgi:hypothetical protein
MDHPCGRSRALPYLVLLRAGFCLPPLLPEARCALTAPFHPYSRRAGEVVAARLDPRPARPLRRELSAHLGGSAGAPTTPLLTTYPARLKRYVFCATGPSGCPARVLPGALSWWSSDFPLPAPVPRARHSLRSARARPDAGSGRLVRCGTFQCTRSTPSLGRAGVGSRQSAVGSRQSEKSESRPSYLSRIVQPSKHRARAVVDVQLWVGNFFDPGLLYDMQFRTVCPTRPVIPLRWTHGSGTRPVSSCDGNLRQRSTELRRRRQ